MSVETKLKISESGKGRICLEETRRKISIGNMGQKRDEETRRKISKGMSPENHRDWKGGISKDPLYKMKFYQKNKFWKEVIEWAHTLPDIEVVKWLEVIDLCIVYKCKILEAKRIVKKEKSYHE